MEAVIELPGEAVEELYDPYHRYAGRAGAVLSDSCLCSKSIDPREEVVRFRNRAALPLLRKRS